MSQPTSCPVICKLSIHCIFNSRCFAALCIIETILYLSIDPIENSWNRWEEGRLQCGQVLRYQGKRITSVKATSHSSNQRNGLQSLLKRMCRRKVRNVYIIMVKFVRANFGICRLCTLQYHFVLQFDSFWVTSSSRCVTKHIDIIRTCLINSPRGVLGSCAYNLFIGYNLDIQSLSICRNCFINVTFKGYNILQFAHLASFIFSLQLDDASNQIRRATNCRQLSLVANKACSILTKGIIQRYGRSTCHVVTHVAQVPFDSVLGLYAEHSPLLAFTLNFRDQIKCHETCTKLLSRLLYLFDSHPLVVKAIS